MSTSLIQLLPLTIDDNPFDLRLKSDIENISSNLDLKVIEALSELRQESIAKEKKYGWVGRELCLNFYYYADSLKTNDFNKYGWKSKAIKKLLKPILSEIGFRHTSIHKLIRATEFILSLGYKSRNSKSLFWHFVSSWCSHISISSLYELSRMSDVGIRKAFNKVKPKYYSTMSTKDIAEQSKPITVRELEEIRRQYPINEFEMRGRGSSNTKVLSSTNNSINQPETGQAKGSTLVPSQGEAFEIPVNDGAFVIHQDSTDIEHEEVQPTQNELFETVLAAIPKLNLDEIYGNEAKLSRLEQIQQNLETLSDMAKPRTSRPKYV